ncbi:hypothetical protein EV368DRAFT_63067 [Lentinula lateritia]|nr:hypothetical protein EV368DRAFT_63067 [Lentinula lateritia]
MKRTSKEEDAVEEHADTGEDDKEVPWLAQRLALILPPLRILLSQSAWSFSGKALQLCRRLPNGSNSAGPSAIAGPSSRFRVALSLLAPTSQTNARYKRNLPLLQSSSGSNNRPFGHPLFTKHWVTSYTASAFSPHPLFLLTWVTEVTQSSYFLYTNLYRFEIQIGMEERAAKTTHNLEMRGNALHNDFGVVDILDVILVAWTLSTTVDSNGA